MVRPLDHVTVIQQINFAEREHQNQVVHPEISRLQAEAIDIERMERDRRRTQNVHKTEKGKIHLQGDTGEKPRKRKGRPGKGGRVDLTA
jgi:hypothetical protein